MKNTAVFVILLLVGLPALAQQPAQAPTQTAGLKETLGNLWGRLRAVTPRSAPPPATTTTVTAGLRGIEATDSELKPYWRGDQMDPASRKEREALDARRPSPTAASSPRRRAPTRRSCSRTRRARSPQMRASALRCRAPRSVSARAPRPGFEDFIRRDPQHPLARDAETALAALR
jgi:hypothetical protein